MVISLLYFPSLSLFFMLHFLADLVYNLFKTDSENSFINANVVMDQIEGVLTQKADTFLKPSTDLVTNLVSGRRLSGSSPGLFVPETEVIPPSNNKPRPNFFNEQDFKPYWTSIDDSGTKSNDESGITPESGKKNPLPANILEVRKAFLNRKNRFKIGENGKSSSSSEVKENENQSSKFDEKTKSTISLSEQLSKIELPKTPTMNKLWITPKSPEQKSESESVRSDPDDKSMNFIRKNRNRLSLPAAWKKLSFRKKRRNMSVQENSFQTISSLAAITAGMSTMPIVQNDTITECSENQENYSGSVVGISKSEDQATSPPPLRTSKNIISREDILVPEYYNVHVEDDDFKDRMLEIMKKCEENITGNTSCKDISKIKSETAETNAKEEDEEPKPDDNEYGAECCTKSIEESKSLHEKMSQFDGKSEDKSDENTVHEGQKCSKDKQCGNSELNSYKLYELMVKNSTNETWL